MSNLNELFNKHSRVHPWAETDNKKTLDLEGLEAVIAEMMPTDDELDNQYPSTYAQIRNTIEGDVLNADYLEEHGIGFFENYSKKEAIKHLRSTILGNDKNG
jgi:hypothetical protein